MKATLKRIFLFLTCRHMYKVGDLLNSPQDASNRDTVLRVINIDPNTKKYTFEVAFEAGAIVNYSGKDEFSASKTMVHSMMNFHNGELA